MMQTMEMCVACKRHLRAQEIECPFCGAKRATTGTASNAKLPRQRLGSAALFGFQAATLATLVGCGAASEDTDAPKSKGSESVADGTGKPSPMDTTPEPSATTEPAPEASETETEPERPDATETEDAPGNVALDAGVEQPMDDIRNPVSIYRAPPSY